MFNRQRVLMRIMANEGGRMEKIRLVKLAFLLKENIKDPLKKNLYEFVPYQYGPYSFTLSYDLRSAERNGWVKLTRSEIQLLRDAGGEISKLGSEISLEIDALTRRYKNVSTSTLISNVYSDFPWYTSLAKNMRRRAAPAQSASPAIFTVGYEGLMLDGLLDLLLRNGIKRLIDVRCNAVARRFGFHKSTLDRHCSDVGIAYTHLSALGIPSSKRANLENPASYATLWQHYEEDVLPSQGASFELVSSLVKREPSALMCMEADALCCHRSRLASAIARNVALPIKELRNL